MIDRWTEAGEAKSVGLLGNAADVFPELQSAAFAPISSPTRPARTTRSTAICRRAGPWQNGSESRKATQSGRKSRPRQHENPCGSDGRFLERRRADARLRQQHPPGRAGREGWKTPSPSRVSCPPISARLFCRGIGPFRWCALSGDPEDILQDRSEDERALPRRTRICTTGSTWRASGSPFKGCLRVSAGSGLGTATRPAWRSTKWSPAAS